MAKKRKATKKAARKKTVKKKARRARRRPQRQARRTPAATVAAPAARAQPHLEAALNALLDERAELDGAIADLERMLGGGSGGTRRAAARTTARGVSGKHRAGSLKEFVERVLADGGVHKVKDIAAGVVRAGYKSKNKTLAKSVGIALTEMKSVKKVGRGQFQRR